MITQALLKHLPNVKVLSTVSQNEDEAAWLAVRTKGIGGSDVGAICGVSPFSSARQIYFNKTGQYNEATQPGATAQERMHFGHMLEPIVANEYAMREFGPNGAHPGYSLVDLNCTMCHKDYAWRRANVDRLIVDADGVPAGILECKTTSEYNNEEWESGEILASYIYQLNWYLHILDLKWGVFACLVGGNKFYSYEVFRNDELLNDTIIPAAEHFWNYNVANMIEPPLQATDKEFADATYATAVKGSEVVFDDDATDDLAATVFDCKAKIKELTSIMEAAQNQLKEKLNTAETAYCRNYVVKWSPRSQRRVDTAALKANYPEVYAACCYTSSFRAMSVKAQAD